MGSKQDGGAARANIAVLSLRQGPDASLLQQLRVGQGSLQGEGQNLVSVELLVLGAGTAWAHSGVRRNRETLNDCKVSPYLLSAWFPNESSALCHVHCLMSPCLRKAAFSSLPSAQGCGGEDVIC